MPTFTDNLGREWTIEITGIEIKLLRKELSVDLLSVFDRETGLLEKLGSDPVLLIDVISVLLTPQIQKRGMDETGFASGLVGDGLQNAIDALVAAIVFFSPPHQQAIIAAMWSETRKLQTETSIKAIALAPEIGKLAAAKVDRELQAAMTALNSPPEKSKN